MSSFESDVFILVIITLVLQDKMPIGPATEIAFRWIIVFVKVYVSIASVL